MKPAPTGTLNTLVLALLSFIAELKEENVIFAMEEPEIALAPHTQRRIATYLLTKTTQWLRDIAFTIRHRDFRSRSHRYPMPKQYGNRNW